MISLLRLYERFGRFGCKEKVNATMFAWSILHGGKKPPFIQGRSINHPEKNWNGIQVDKVIPTKSLDELNSIDQIEGRASCQGTLTKSAGELEVPTYFIFRSINQDKSYVESIVGKLNKYPDIMAGYDVGLGNQFRIGVIGDMSYETDSHSFIQWWKILPKRIKESL